VINAGVSAYGTDQELLYYQLMGHNFEPDLVLVLQSRNDVQDNLDHKLFSVENGAAIRTPGNPLYETLRVGVFEPIREFLYDYSQTYRYSLLFQRVTTDNTYFLPDYLYVEPLPPEMVEGWQLTDALITQLASKVQADGSDFAIAYVPERIQMGGAAWEDMLAKTEVAGTSWDIDATNTRAAQLADNINVPFLDPTPAFRDALAVSDEPLFFAIDIHWTVRGHRIIADELFKFLQDSNLLS
jgi:hypothetical protein